MNGQGDPFSWWSRAWLDVRRGWPAYLAVGLIFVGVLVFLFREDSFLHAKGQATEAHIVSLTTSFGGRSRLNGPTAIVAVKTEDGLTGQESVPLAWVRGCKVGDPVSVALVEGRLRIEPWPCTVETAGSDE